MMNFKKLFLSSILSICNYFYYCYRFIRYSGINLNFKDSRIFKFFALIIIHALEKSISFTTQKEASGYSMLKKLQEINIYSKKKSFINKYINLTILNFKNHKKKLYINKNYDRVTYKIPDFSKENFDQFFLSRRSCRNFSKKIIPLNTLKKALSLAINSPSVCNRKPWKIHFSNNKIKIDKILKLHNGNKGFDHTIHNLLIITCDLRAFVSGKEIYQSWIDGGIFSSSLLYSFHSLGIATCCLNWSQSPLQDLRLRKEVSTINKSENIIMLIAFGYPLNSFVCDSKSDEINEFISKII